MLRLPVLLACLCLACPASGQQLGSARDSLERFGLGLERLRAGFEQVVVAADGELLEHGRGEVAMQRPDLFRWRYAGEFPELIVADGRHVWSYDQALEQVTVREQTGLLADSPLTLLTDLSGLEQQFTATELGRHDGTLVLELKSVNPDSEFERVLVGMRDDVPALMVMEDAFGMRTEIRFQDIERNPVLDAGLFEFAPPPGVDVIGEPGTP